MKILLSKALETFFLKKKEKLAIYKSTHFASFYLSFRQGKNAVVAEIWLPNSVFALQLLKQVLLRSWTLEFHQES